MAPEPTTPRAAATRERILDAALSLFNERGVAAVTTNHIAATAGISPGNLYYWFRHKEAIVRALYLRFAADHRRLWDSAEAATDGPLTPDDLRGRLVDAAAVGTRYRFLTRDILALVHADPELAELYREVRADRIARFAGMATVWRAAGVIGPVSDAELAAVIEAVWIVSEAWLPFAELDGRPADPEHGAALVTAILGRYLTPDHRLDPWPWSGSV